MNELDRDQVLDIVDEGMRSQFGAVPRCTALIEVAAAGEERESKRAELLDREFCSDRMNETDEDIGFALGQADDMAFGYQLDSDARL